MHSSSYFNYKQPKYFLNLLGLISVLIFFGNFFTFLSGYPTIINSSISELFYNISITSFIDFIRENYSIISLILNITIFIFLNIKKININKFFFICILLLFLPQIIGLILNTANYNSFNIQSLNTTLFMVSSLINVINIFTLKNSIYFRYFFYVPFIALSIQLILFFSYFSIFQLQYGGFSFKLVFADKVYNLYFNSNGLGRTTTLLYVLSIFHFFESKNKFGKYFYYVTSIILIFIVLSLSGRFNTLGLIVINFLVFLYYSKNIIKNWIILFLTIFILFYGLQFYKKYQMSIILKNMEKIKILGLSEQEEHNNIQILEADLKDYISNNSIIIRKSPPNIRDNTLAQLLPMLFQDPKKIANKNIYKHDFITSGKFYKIFSKLDNISTGRLTKWIFILANNQRQYFGYGANMDRQFFNKIIENKIKPRSNKYYKANSFLGANDAASGILYQYIAGGGIGLISLIIFYLIIINNYYKKTSEYQSMNTKIFITIFCFLTFRIIFENGFLIFGIDFLLFIVSLHVMVLKLKS